MKMKKRFLSILLSLVMVLGLMPGMGLTAYADAHLAITVNPTGGGSVTQVQKNSTEFTCTAIPNSGFTFLKWTYVDSNWANRESTNNPQVFSDSCRSIKAFFVQVVNVSDVLLDPPAAQTIEVDGKVSFTATVTPDSATDKTVKWSVGGTDTGAVKLYTDADCTTEVGANATDKLTVYAKRISTGSATVTATSNADSTKTASCAVTVVPTPYPLWVGGVQVTSANASNITGGDPVTYNIVEAFMHRRVIGRPKTGDWVAVVLNGEDSLKADMVINLDELKGQWVQWVAPTLRKNPMTEVLEEAVQEEMDSLLRERLKPVEMGFALKRHYEAQPIGLRHALSARDDDPVARRLAQPSRGAF